MHYINLSFTHLLACISWSNRPTN